MSSTKSSRDSSAGRKRELASSLSQRELVRVYGRIHSLLSKRVRESKKESDRFKGKDKLLYKRYIECAKDLYAYVRLMELCQALHKDVIDMKEVLGALGKSSLGFADEPSKKN